MSLDSGLRSGSLWAKFPVPLPPVVINSCTLTVFHAMDADEEAVQQLVALVSRYRLEVLVFQVMQAPRTPAAAMATCASVILETSFHRYTLTKLGAHSLL